MYFKTLLYSLLTLSLLSAQPAQNIDDKFQKATTQINTTSNVASKPKLTIKQATLKAINEARGLNQICSRAVFPLRWNKQLYVRAKEHSIDMAVNGKLSHVGSGTATDITAKNLKINRGSYFFERVNQKVNSRKILSGELIIRTTTNTLKGPKELIDYWIKNPKDCKVIMDSRFSDVALAKVISNKDNKAYWTLLLAGARR